MSKMKDWSLAHPGEKTSDYATKQELKVETPCEKLEKEWEEKRGKWMLTEDDVQQEQPERSYDNYQERSQPW